MSILADLKNKKLFLFDIDGTLAVGDTLYEGSAELLDYIDSIGGKSYFITNNSTRSGADYVERFCRAFGLETMEEQFITSGYMTIRFLKEHYAGKKIFVLGTASFVTELRRNGLDVTETADEDASPTVTPNAASDDNALECCSILECSARTTTSECGFCPPPEYSARTTTSECGSCNTTLECSSCNTTLEFSSCNTTLEFSSCNTTLEFSSHNTGRNVISCVVVAYDSELTYDKLIQVCKVLSTCNVPFYATNPDLCCPIDFGFIPDCGAICKMITDSTGKSPIYLGKPSREVVELCLSESGFSKEETLVVGDRLYTDIACGINGDVDTCVVFTGEAKPEDMIHTEFPATYCFENVKELLDAIHS